MQRWEEKILFDTEISFRRLPAPIYTIYSLPYTAFGLGVRHTGLLGALQKGQMIVTISWSEDSSSQSNVRRVTDVNWPMR